MNYKNRKSVYCLHFKIKSMRAANAPLVVTAMTEAK